MTISTSIRLLGATAIVATLSACGGAPGGPGGGEPNYTAIEPMKGMSAGDYQELQDRRVIAADGEAKAFSSLATTQTSDATFSGPVGYRTDGTVTFYAGRTDGDTTESPGIDVVVGDDASNRRSFHPDYDNGENNLGNPIISAGQGDLGGQTVYLGRRDEAADSTRVIYIPRGDSEMYVGAFASDISGIRGMHGVFGRETTASEMGRLDGVATYTGGAAATVNRNMTAGSAESGYYEGTATAAVDFDTNRVNIDASVSRDRNFSSGTDRVDMSVRNAQISNNGRITGAATYDGLNASGLAVSGSIDGRFFGPNGESIGATYIGSAENGGEAAHIVGHTVLNRD